MYLYCIIWVKRLEIEIKKTYYSYERYKVVSTFVLLHHEKELSVAQLGDFLRISDKFVKVDDTRYFIILSFTLEENASKASQNLLQKLDAFFNDRSSFIAINTINLSNSPNMLINKLTQTMAEIQKNQYARIEDESVLSNNLHY